MMYYLERKGLLKSDFTIDDETFYKFFYDTYLYFENKGYFVYAFEGVQTYDYRHTTTLEPPSMSPSPQIYFMMHLHNTELFPIKSFNSDFEYEEVFTMIEILHNHVAKINWDYKKTPSYTISKEEKKEFREYINNILKFYDKGYYLSEKGMIMGLPEDALLDVIERKLPVETPYDVVEKVDTAIKMFFRFDTNMEQKKKAINILADILEPLRRDLKENFAIEMQHNAKHGDDLIFQIVNRFNVRHNDEKQVKEYSKDIWYDWMAHYYLATIHAYYQLQEKYAIDKELQELLDKM